MTQVLFVDDEEKILKGLKRTLRPMRKQWDMQFVSDSEAALEMIRGGSFDVIISDMRMPGYSGVDLLSTAREHCPHAVRIGLSGYADSEMVLEAARVTHQFLSKPCSLDKLVGAVDRVVNLREKLGSVGLRRNIASITALPSLPNSYSRIMDEANSSHGTLDRIGEIIDQDPSVTAKVLQLVNSSFFGLQTKITTASQAVTLLGLNYVRSLVLSVDLFRCFEGKDGADEIESVWRHSAACGTLAKNVASRLRTVCPGVGPRVEEQAMLAGMLHDIGNAIEITEFRQAYKMAQRLASESDIDIIDAERQMLGCSHADIGGYLLELWGFPSIIVEAVVYHHSPGESSDNSAGVLTAVHIANALMNANGDEQALAGMLDNTYLESVGVGLLERQRLTKLWEERPIRD